MDVSPFVINYGIIATVPHPTDPEQLSVLHFCGFENEPGEEEYKQLYAELMTDAEFGLTDVDFDLNEAPQSVIDIMCKKIQQHS